MIQRTPNQLNVEYYLSDKEREVEIRQRTPNQLNAEYYSRDEKPKRNYENRRRKP